jgi:hypothetical protein
MGLQLVSDEERLVYEGDGFQIFYRRITNHKRAQIVQRHTNRKGETNNVAVAEEMLEWCITGWSGVTDVNPTTGEYVETVFSPDKIKRIPDEVGGELIELFGLNADEKAVEVKNSPTTSASNTTTEDSPASDAD